MGRRPIPASRRCSHGGDGPFFTIPSHRPNAFVPQLAHVSGGEIARDAIDAGAVAAVGGEIDLDHGIVESGPLGISRSDRRIGGKLDDAFVVVGDLKLELRHQHAAALDAADLANAQCHVLARYEGPGRHEHSFHAGARVGRAADDLHRVARSGIDHAHAQAVGVRMLFGRGHAGDGERREHLAPLDDALDFKSDHGEPVHNGCQRRLGVEMLLQPSDGQFHHCADPGPISSPVRRGSLASMNEELLFRTAIESD